MLAMLSYELIESSSTILARFEDAIKVAKATEQRADEIKSPQSDDRYKYRRVKPVLIGALLSSNCLNPRLAITHLLFLIVLGLKIPQKVTV